MKWPLVKMPLGQLLGEVFRACPTGGYLRMTHDTLERQCLPAGLGRPRDPPGHAEQSYLGEGSLGFPANDKGHVTDLE